jgi:hypothetical protein
MNDLCEIFTNWCEKHGLPQWSADELLDNSTVDLTPGQQKFLEAFITVWEEAENE